MPAVKIALGLIVILVSAALASGLADTVMPLPPFGAGAALVLAGAGAVLAASGLYDWRLRRDGGDANALRRFGRSGFILVLILAVVFAVPSLAAPLNLIEVGGFPLGYYVAAQGALIVLAMLAFVAASRLDALDDESDEG
jgi:putative solute:sodium symporter small subunit